MSKIHILIFSLCLLVYLALFDSVALSREITAYTAKDAEGIIPSSEFDCREDVYVRAEVQGLNEADHEASVEWINPKGKNQNSSSYSFKGKDQNVWFWLKLHPSFGGKLLKPLVPSYGMEEFMGGWTVKLYVDGQLVTKRVFFVAC